MHIKRCAKAYTKKRTHGDPETKLMQQLALGVPLRTEFSGISKMTFFARLCLIWEIMTVSLPFRMLRPASLLLDVALWRIASCIDLWDLRQRSSKPTRTHLFGCWRLSLCRWPFWPCWPCDWESKVFKVNQNRADATWIGLPFWSTQGFSEEFWVQSKTSKQGTDRHRGIVVVVFGTEASPFASVTWRAISCNGKQLVTCPTCPRWGSPVFYIALVLAWNPGIWIWSFLERSFLCKKRCCCLTFSII